MIIIKIMGGLGNQMFQYALARRLQLMGRNVKIDTSYFDDIPDTDTPRLFTLIWPRTGLLVAIAVHDIYIAIIFAGSVMADDFYFISSD